MGDQRKTDFGATSADQDARGGILAMPVSTLFPELRQFALRDIGSHTRETIIELSAAALALQTARAAFDEVHAGMTRGTRSIHIALTEALPVRYPLTTLYDRLMHRPAGQLAHRYEEYSHDPRN